VPYSEKNLNPGVSSAAEQSTCVLWVAACVRALAWEGRRGEVRAMLEREKELGEGEVVDRLLSDEWFTPSSG